MDLLKAKPLEDGAYEVTESPRSSDTRLAVAFHFCRVGDDKKAMKMLEHLDNCDEVGQYVDCLPSACRHIRPQKYRSFHN